MVNPGDHFHNNGEAFSTSAVHGDPPTVAPPHPSKGSSASGYDGVNNRSRGVTKPEPTSVLMPTPAKEYTKGGSKPFVDAATGGYNVDRGGTFDASATDAMGKGNLYTTHLAGSNNIVRGVETNKGDVQWGQPGQSVESLTASLGSNAPSMPSPQVNVPSSFIHADPFTNPDQYKSPGPYKKPVYVGNEKN